MSAPVVEIAALSLAFRRRGRLLPVIRDLSLSIGAGEAFGLVGESGCGKSTVAMAIMRYLPDNAVVTGGGIRLFGEDSLNADPATLRQWRGERIAMVYQDPGSALNPALRIGTQVAEVFRYHRGNTKEKAWRASAEMLERVKISGARAVLRKYPHELSGGQQQRVMIAMALAVNPEVLILDEPTTGLDATVEAEILDLVEGLRREYRTAILFISHNLGIVARLCERIGVLYAGHLVEEAPAARLFADPRHPYTAALLRCYPRAGLRKDSARFEPIAGALPTLGAELHGCPFAPRCPLVRAVCESELPPLFPSEGGRTARCFFADEVPQLAQRALGTAQRPASARGAELLCVEQLRKRFKIGRETLVAVDDVSLSLARGEVLGLVGESGSGKSTLAKCVVGLLAPSAGAVTFDGTDVAQASRGARRPLARRLQMVFQNPDTSLNPSKKVRRILGRAVALLSRRRQGTRRRVQQLAEAVRLQPGYLGQRPKALSGGLKQRVAIARALAGSPELVVCDEPVSALDVSVQAAILNLLADLQAEHGLSYLFISHDLAVVHYLADRIAVMYLGQIVELGTATAVFSAPHHPYTEALLSAAPTLEGTSQRVALKPDLPDPLAPPSGCRFHTRCHRFLGAICQQQEPPWQRTAKANAYRCHIPPAELAAKQR
ncbi:MAG TPA: ABC transporter ATP-binding protein, partial [Kiloniellales bacterium]|nr:ABC transporter ATP-binding protein [Kiloniellales bacterium]